MHKGLPTPDGPRPDLPGIAAAWRFAMRHAPAGPGFRVGLCDARGHVVAATMLGTYAQVKTFSRQLGKAGYAAVTGGSPGGMQGCDVLFVPGSRAAP